VGEGKIDFRAVLRMLKDLGFKGTLNIELKKNDDLLISKQRLEPMLRELGVLPRPMDADLTVDTPFCT